MLAIFQNQFCRQEILDDVNLLPIKTSGFWFTANLGAPPKPWVHHFVAMTFTHMFNISMSVGPLSCQLEILWDLT